MTPMKTLFLVLTWFALTLPAAQSEDWPTYLHDHHRSATTPEPLSFPLEEHWLHQPNQPPTPAWPPPAEADFWHHLRQLNARVTFDRAFHVAAADGLIYYGSSSEDRICCLDATTGQVRWTFYAGGPLRLAPVLRQGRLYIGADDGKVYCLDGKTGALQWQQTVAPTDEWVMGNGRMISLAPVRTGLALFEGTVYCCAGLFPQQGARLCALDGKTGHFLWHRDLEVSAQGYLLVSPTRLYVPTGRTSPVVFDRRTGERLGEFKGSAGAYALIAEDLLIHGPGNQGELGLSRADSRDHLATFPGLHMIINGPISYLHTQTSLSALDRTRYLELLEEKNRFNKEAKEQEKARKKLDPEKDASEIAGLEDLIKRTKAEAGRCAEAMRGCTLWDKAWAYPHALILAGETLIAGGDNEVAAFRTKDGERLWQAPVQGRAQGLAVANGRLLVSCDSGAIHCFAAGVAPKASVESTSPLAPAPKASAMLAEWLLQETGVRKGYCLVIGCGRGELAGELARQSNLQVIGVDPDPKKILAGRRHLSEVGLYGNRVTLQAMTPDHLPFPDYFANLIIHEEAIHSGTITGDPREIFRLLRPWGGIAVTGSAEPDKLSRTALEAWTQAAPPASIRLKEENGFWAFVCRGALEGEGEWTHMYADPGNSACSEDRHVSGPMRLQWFGRPGPRQMIDRHHRNVPPLYKEGRLFVPGDNRVFAMDAYNGTTLWEAEVPGSRRLGVFLDSSNLVVDSRFLYLVHGQQCDAFAVETGTRQKTYTLPQNTGEEELAWGYVARTGKFLLGTGRLPDASYQETSHEADRALWYDNMSMVTSRTLFALDQETGETRWTYRDGILLNTTLTVGNGKIYFVESHSPAARANTLGRMPGGTFLEGSENYLVALDLETGHKVFSRPVDLTQCRLIVYLNCAGDTLLLSGAEYEGNKLWYFFYAFDSHVAKPLWTQSHDSEYTPGGGHGEQNRHPTIVGNTIYAYPYAYSLQTGERLESYKFSRSGHGCGGVSASANALFWRGGNPTMRDLGPDGAVRKINVVSRPGCWINMIPAGGLLLIPEASSGCTCAFPLQTSMAFRPHGDTAFPARHEE